MTRGNQITAVMLLAKIIFSVSFEQDPPNADRHADLVSWLFWQWPCLPMVYFQVANILTKICDSRTSLYLFWLDRVVMGRKAAAGRRIISCFVILPLWCFCWLLSSRLQLEAQPETWFMQVQFSFIKQPSDMKREPTNLFHEKRAKATVHVLTGTLSHLSSAN